MTDDMIELGRRAVACKGWRWMPGMLVDFYYLGEDDDGKQYTRRLDCDGWGDSLGKESACFVDGEEYDGPEVRDLTPRLSDPATLGCVLALVREAWGDPTLCAIYDHDDGEWYLGRWEDGGIVLRSFGITEQGAIVAALESAP